MTYIPNTRNRFNHPVYEGTRGSQKETDNRNAYWEGYLNDEDGSAVLVTGYDYAADTIDNAFHNLDCYEDVLLAAELIQNEVGGTAAADEDIVFGDKDLDQYSLEEIRAMSPLTKTARAFREIMMDWLESERDSFIADNIEGMDEAEYNECVKKADEEGYENCVIRGYDEETKKALQENPNDKQ